MPMELTARQKSFASPSWRPVDKETGKAGRCGVYHAVSAIAVVSVRGCNCGGDRERRRSTFGCVPNHEIGLETGIIHMDRL